jgi:hypothetical protein
MIVATISATNDAAASGHMCQMSPKRTAWRARENHARGVFFGMWIGTKPDCGRTCPRCFMSHHASLSWTIGVNAKL